MRSVFAVSRLRPGLVIVCLAAAGTFGCASKNPLMDEPSPPAASTSKPVPAATTPSSAPATPPATAATGSDPSGVQTSKQRRFLGIFSPYRVDIQQGNFVSREMVAQLRPGMTPEQVRFVLGTPLLTDIFHADRWDYVFRLQKGNGETITSRVGVYFQNGRLARVDDGNLPTEKDYLSLIAGSAPPPPPAAPAAPAK